MVKFALAKIHKSNVMNVNNEYVTIYQVLTKISRLINYIKFF